MSLLYSKKFEKMVWNSATIHKLPIFFQIYSTVLSCLLFSRKKYFELSLYYLCDYVLTNYLLRLRDIIRYFAPLIVVDDREKSAAAYHLRLISRQTTTRPVNNNSSWPKCQKVSDKEIISIFLSSWHPHLVYMLQVLHSE